MCGIAGHASADPAAPGALAIVRRGIERLAHRGPDGEGEKAMPGCALAHRRLAIIDLSERAAQPMTNEDGTLWIVFNGEIYNHLELRRELQPRHPFRSRSDTEVILHLYEEDGAECVQHLNGMFAFAIWDTRSETLFLARDRLGEKPLYYSFLPDGRLLFASELKSLLLSHEIDRRFDPETIEEFFAFGYVPDPRTIYRSVRKLAPAHYLFVRRGEQPLEPSAYWDVEFLDGAPIRREEIAGELITRLR